MIYTVVSNITNVNAEPTSLSEPQHSNDGHRFSLGETRARKIEVKRTSRNYGETAKSSSKKQQRNSE